ncbi:MAG: hypothetical protein IJX95_04345 [Lachnospiraceae bacterium]|nr:hypothetical protein [Lachnospiraceae bacterium]
MIKKNYKFGFDIWGLILFLVIMIPNFIWFAVPAPNDILRAESVTKVADAIGSVCQVAMVVSLCALMHKERKKISINPLILAVIGCCLLYYLCWILYYTGMANTVVILGMTVVPCLAFLFFALDRKNGIALIPIGGFTICHMIFGVVNFII